jgi:molybdopterin synthase catalytic subunit
MIAMTPRTPRVEIVRRAISVPRELGIHGGEMGAAVEFQGVVRDMEDGRKIVALEYECHEEMALALLRGIAEAVAAFHELDSLVVVHRVGVIPVGETSLYVRAVTRHRREAFLACEETIIRLKRDVPIWKHPIHAD